MPQAADSAPMSVGDYLDARLLQLHRIKATSPSPGMWSLVVQRIGELRRLVRNIDKGSVVTGSCPDLTFAYEHLQASHTSLQVRYRELQDKYEAVAKQRDELRARQDAMVRLLDRLASELEKEGGR